MTLAEVGGGGVEWTACGGGGVVAPAVSLSVSLSIPPALAPSAA